ncbi:hypothetical protein EDD27_7826 [Nonomuraea polychroma]|uniref:Uncharacterized protein n=1 Tax=Nonomuraea polychroma TaxID=46176 RepID=A0A438MGR7_9ACTN|nr:hypothetical protein [Nonomuraea polychroma]RVX45049.1 hypothetical protein EDD27_7826 [Nonomuraea polychroma]
MERKKLTSALLVPAAAAGLLLAPATTASAQASVATTVTKAASASAGAYVERDSVRCSKPRNQFANYSWGEGNTSVTIYFNNHCSHRVSVRIKFVRKGSVGDQAAKYRCMTVNAKTKGKKKFYAAVYKPYSVTRVKSC